MSRSGHGASGGTGDTPDPYAGFGGHVGRTVAGSIPWWPPRDQAPQGAPNVVLILCDDLGYSDVACFGAEIPTPHIDRLATEGVRYTNFHVTPQCSPTRAALLTGLNPHHAGFGTTAQIDPGFPGYTMELPLDAMTLGEILRDNGYATMAVGKWHLCKDSDMSAAGSRHSWPLQRGFDRYYGHLEALEFHHQPHRLIEDNHALTVDRYPDDYYYTDDLTDRAIAMVREARSADERKPFFLYFAHAAVHGPLQARDEDIRRFRGRYDVGWDRIREARLARQFELGVVPRGTRLPARNSEPGYGVVAWDDVPVRSRRLFARYMEVYAAMVASIDRSVGRLRAALEELGAWQNTLVIFTSDNGASREGGNNGTYRYLRPDDPGDGVLDDRQMEMVGGPRLFVHYPQGWAMASNTPFRLYKRTVHAGGHSVPLVVCWPAGGVERGGIRRQYAYVTDLVPTLLDLVGVERPTHHHGRAQRPLDGSSFAGTLRDQGAPSAHREQYFEMKGHRGFYRDGWEVVTFHLPLTRFTDDEWQLYDLKVDPTETTDLARERPEKVRELSEAWERAAWANGVYPLDEGSGVMEILRPPRTEPPAAVTLRRGAPTLERTQSQRLVRHRSFRIVVRLTHRLGDRGTLVAHGDQLLGYAVHVDHDMLRYVHNVPPDVTVIDGGALSAGAHEIVVDVRCTKRAIWDVGLSVDGVERARREGLPMPMGPMLPYRGIDIGIDRGSPVHWEVYEREGPFPWTGAIEYVRYEPGMLAADAADLQIEERRRIGSQCE